MSFSSPFPPSSANRGVCRVDVAKALFPYEDPIGRTVQIDTEFYVIVGQTAARDPTAAIGGSIDSQDFYFDVYVPLPTLKARIGDLLFSRSAGSREAEVVELSQITLSVDDARGGTDSVGLTVRVLPWVEIVLREAVTVPLPESRAQIADIFLDGLEPNAASALPAVWTEPEPVLADTGRPLIFYAVEDPAFPRIALTKSSGGASLSICPL